MSVDPHEIRMAVGEQAAAMLDAYDDDTIALMTPVCESANELGEHLKTLGMPRLIVWQLILGLCVGAIYHDEMNGEGEGRNTDPQP